MGKIQPQPCASCRIFTITGILHDLRRNTTGNLSCVNCVKTLFRSLNTFQNSDLRPEENILQICVEMKIHRRNLKDLRRKSIFTIQNYNCFVAGLG